MSLTLYVATSNKGKLRDFAAWAQEGAAGQGIAVLPLPGLETMEAPEETGLTFEANAHLKAEHYSRLAPGLTVLADDSGLDVDALNGAPGVRSARYARDAGWPAEATDSGELTDDQRNNAYLLHMLQGVDVPSRTAHYRCALVAACNGQSFAMAHGMLPGIILSQPQGHGGFGYDPLFLIPRLGLTMAEVDGQIRQKISHRGEALRTLLALPALYR